MHEANCNDSAGENENEQMDNSMAVEVDFHCGVDLNVVRLACGLVRGGCFFSLQSLRVYFKSSKTLYLRRSSKEL